MSKLAVIKIGTSLITKENGSLKMAFLSRVCKEIAMVKKAGWDVVVVTSGAMACGVGVLEGKPHNIEERAVFACVGQDMLMGCYRSFLRPFGIDAAQALLTWREMACDEARLLIKKHMERMLANGIVPIVNENDLTATEELSFGDNDQLAAMVAVLLEADKLVVLSDVDGFYNKNPKEHPNAMKIDVVGRITEEHESCVDEKLSKHSLGGMKSKLSAVRMATESGVEAVIVSGIEDCNTIPRVVIKNEPIGTVFLAQ